MYVRCTAPWRMGHLYRGYAILDLSICPRVSGYQVADTQVEARQEGSDPLDR
jgi:hypothetical protein